VALARIGGSGGRLRGIAYRKGGGWCRRKGQGHPTRKGEGRRLESRERSSTGIMGEREQKLFDFLEKNFGKHDRATSLASAKQ